MNFRDATTRIITTHALHLLKYMDYIYILKKGRIKLQGDYDTLCESHRFKRIYKKYILQQITATTAQDNILKQSFAAAMNKVDSPWRSKTGNDDDMPQAIS